MTGVRGFAGWGVAVLSLAGLLSVGFHPQEAPWLVLSLLFGGLWPLRLAWVASRGTALRGAVAWMALALAWDCSAMIVAASEPLASGRPWTGHLTYLGCTAALASLLSVLNARRPGAGAWALLMGLLVVVMLLPWLEGSGLARRPDPLDRLALTPPWNLFFLLLALTSVTNYLPTRYGPAAVLVGIMLSAEYAGLRSRDWPPARLGAAWVVSAWSLGTAVWVAWWRAGRREAVGLGDLERLWLWFRDHWGLAWGMRVRERFDRSAGAAGWPIRLGWQGVEHASNKSSSGDVESPPEAVATLSALLRRFADARVVEAAAHGRPCEADAASRS